MNSKMQVNELIQQIDHIETNMGKYIATKNSKISNRNMKWNRTAKRPLQCSCSLNARDY